MTTPRELADRLELELMRFGSSSSVAAEAARFLRTLAEQQDLAADLADVKKERDALKALLAEWLDGMYQGPDFLRRVKIAVHGTLAEIVRGAKE